MKLLIGLFIMGLLSACTSQYKPGQHVCYRGMDLGAVESIPIDVKLSLPTDARPCN